MSTILHKFETLYLNTARKNGEKYLGKDGTQAWSVGTKVSGQTYYNMIYQEELLPKKGQTYNIELKEEGAFKNWSYKLLTKKEQILSQSQPEQILPPQEEWNDPNIYAEHITRLEPVPIKNTPKKEEVDWEAISRGKVRHGVAVAFISQGKELKQPIIKEIEDRNKQIIEEMELWVNYIMNGK